MHFPEVGKLVFLGVCIGLNAAIVSIVSEWLGDIKMGYCSDGWWLNQQFCCWEIEGEEVDGCDAWHSWSHVTLARWMVFVLFAVSEDPFSRGDDVLIIFILFPFLQLMILEDRILVHRVPSCQIIRQVCSRVRYLRNQVHSRWIRHARLSRIRYILH